MNSTNTIEIINPSESLPPRRYVTVEDLRLAGYDEPALSPHVQHINAAPHLAESARALERMLNEHIASLLLPGEGAPQRPGGTTPPPRRLVRVVVRDGDEMVDDPHTRRGGCRGSGMRRRT